MDIKTTIGRKNNKSYLLWGAGFLVLAHFVWLVFSRSDDEISRSDISIVKVEQSALKVFVSGFGKLKSKKQRIITSPAPAIVEEIFIYPGDDVQESSTILKLSSPMLEDELRKLEMEVAMTTFSIREKSFERRNSVLGQRSKIMQLKSELQKLEFKAESVGTLVESGIVSKLDYENDRFDIKLLKNRLKIESELLKEFEEMEQQGSLQQAVLITKITSNYEEKADKLHQLNVKAGMAGKLQTLNVKLGQSVTLGDILVSVGNSNALHAELLIAQREAPLISPGNDVTIDIFGESLKGRVTRISSLVQEGMVTAEINLEDSLPEKARPELSIQGEIYVSELTDVLHIPHPAGVKENSVKTLYKLSKDGGQAQRVDVSFGIVTDGKIQIVSGLKSGDDIIVSDLLDSKAETLRIQD